MDIMIGVEEVEIEMETKKITARGYDLEEEKVLKGIEREGKAAEPWPCPYPPSYLFASFYKYPSYIVNHFYDNSSSKNVVAAAQNQNIYSFFHTPSIYSAAVASDDAIASLFSDDNPHACSIM